MSKTFKRNIVTTTIEVNEIVVKDGVPSFVRLEDIILVGKVSKEKATKLAMKTYSDKTVAVTGQTEEVKKYEISYDLFLKHANLVQEKAAETKVEYDTVA